MISWIKKFRITMESYVFDPSIDIKYRTFVLFSVATLVALYLAIPAGLIMGEPLSATIATLVGAVAFTIYFAYSFNNSRIKRASRVISFLLIFFFLPSMFFPTEGPKAVRPSGCC